MVTKFAKYSLSLIAASTLVGCAYQVGDENNPLARKVTWFSYLDAGDIRDSCTPGSADRYRLVYNGHYQEQVRTYDISVSPDGSGQLHQHVFGKANLHKMQADVSSISSFLKSVTAPWQGLELNHHVTKGAVADLQAGLQQSPANSVGLDLPSYSFYWIAATCQDGTFAYRAWEWPAGFEQTTFVPFLMAMDISAIPLNPPRKVPVRSLDANYEYDRSGDVNYFQIKVGATGLDRAP